MGYVVGIKFNNKGKVYHFNSNKIDLKKDMTVVVDTEKGHQFGTVVKLDCKSDSSGMKKVVRVATQKDFSKNTQNIKDSEKALKECEKLIKKYGLKMKLIDVSYTFDRKQLLFSYVADDRIDFRELVKELARTFHTRIEMRQVGVRDKAKDIGGLGPCGRQLCCTLFLNEFESVSINNAKTQGLALNPTKISGACGRLMCCLKYEDKQYKEMRKDLPRVGENVKTEQGRGKVISVNVIARTYRVRTDKEIIELEAKENNGSN